MEYKKAAEILIKMLEKQAYNKEEKEALKTAIGIMSWGILADKSVKAKKAKREKSAKW